MRRGNVLFVTIDQLRADVVEGQLSGFAPMRAFDRLKAEGAHYLNHYTTAVPCGPARASLMTGLYAFNHRSIRNGAPLARNHATLGTELRRLGVEPLLFGYGDIGPDPSDHAPADPDLASYEHPARGFRELVEMRFESMGEWTGFLLAQGYDLPRPLPQRLFEIYRPQGGAITGPALYSAEHSDTAYLTDRVIEALEPRRDGGWFAHVTYIRPHPPFVAPAPWNTLVAPGDAPPPVSETVDHPFRDAWFSERSNHGLWIGFNGDCAALAPAEIADLRAVYLGLAAEVDHHIARLLDWLDATGQTEDTLVIVTADHGEMLGDQGYWGKDAPFRAAHHVPLLIRDPRAPGARRIGALTESIDLAPTILRWLGGAPPPAMDGGDLSGPPERGVCLTEIDYADPVAPTRFQCALGLETTRCNAAVLRDPRWTLVHFNGGLPPLLFDRVHDPQESCDFAATAGAQFEIARLRAAMLDLRMTRADRRLTEWRAAPSG